MTNVTVQRIVKYCAKCGTNRPHNRFVDGDGSFNDICRFCAISNGVGTYWRKRQ